MSGPLDRMMKLLNRRSPTADEASRLMQAGFTLYHGERWKKLIEEVVGAVPEKTGDQPFIPEDMSAMNADICKLVDLEETFIYIDRVKCIVTAVQALEICTGVTGSIPTPLWLCQTIEDSFGKPYSTIEVTFTIDSVLNAAKIEL